MNISPKEHKKIEERMPFSYRDISINDYYRKMKGMANDMCILSETITDWHLILNIR
jgi:hypothetical protein